MTILKAELRRGAKALILWTAVIGFLLGICILIYPEMESQMNEISGMFSEMGSFSAAFGMDRVNFGEFMGFFAVECGNVLGLGGALFGALLGIGALAGEEKEGTAEFLLTHPVSRRSVLLQKLGAVLLQILILNGAVLGISLVSALLVGEAPEGKTFVLLFLAYLILQMEIASICFGISAFLSRGGQGLGLGIAALAYFLNIIANLTEDAGFLKYITPFGYAEGADIVAEGSLNSGYLAAGIALALLGIGAAFVWYQRKDIA
ncbi:MAG: ABC transporter permease subunit [Lachnospiraceae bacterium]|nr:ABC transporter permease subunit [Lachnospiraceae bacterium]MDE7354385.1 ABC transporter permease [Acetatifactor sp.]